MVSIETRREETMHGVKREATAVKNGPLWEHKFLHWSGCQNTCWVGMGTGWTRHRIWLPLTSPKFLLSRANWDSVRRVSVSVKWNLTLMSYRRSTVLIWRTAQEWKSRKIQDVLLDHQRKVERPCALARNQHYLNGRASQYLGFWFFVHFVGLQSWILLYNVQTRRVAILWLFRATKSKTLNMCLWVRAWLRCQ